MLLRVIVFGNASITILAAIISRYKVKAKTKTYALSVKLVKVINTTSNSIGTCGMVVAF